MGKKSKNIIIAAAISSLVAIILYASGEIVYWKVPTISLLVFFALTWHLNLDRWKK